MNSSQIAAPIVPEAETTKVHEFWNAEACGSQYVRAKKGTAEFFEEYRHFRFEMEWHIPLLVPFAETEGKKVLEIGCGNGADGTMFALAGANYTGVDLTEAAVEATRRHFEVLGLEGKFQLENAEKLSFEDDSFDFVYSYGVLHHTADPGKAFAEVYRVLKPSGGAVLMVYNKHSFNYYVRILGYMRARVLLRSMSRTGRMGPDRKNLGGGAAHIRGNESDLVWQVHDENFLRQGWSYLRARNFVHHATDGPGCPVARVYAAKELRDALKQFSLVRIKTAHFPLRRYSFAKWVPLSAERWFASAMGWYLLVYLTK